MQSTNNNIKVPGKIILSGEYGGSILGHSSIVVPSPLSMKLTFERDHTDTVRWEWEEIDSHPNWYPYIDEIIELAQQKIGDVSGTILIENTIPLGKGMGSSTALVIGITRLIGNEFSSQEKYKFQKPNSNNLYRDIALSIEDHVNPGHSGMDFSAIWVGSPIKFSKEHGVETIELDRELLDGAVLIDTGKPDQTTAELIATIRNSDSKIAAEASNIIANCTQRLIDGEGLLTVLPDHHKAQCMLGVVPPEVQGMIGTIEAAGGAAKVIGAGGRTGGGGMVLAIADNDFLKSISHTYKIRKLKS